MYLYIYISNIDGKHWCIYKIAISISMNIWYKYVIIFTWMIINADFDSMCFHFFWGCSSRKHLPNVFANALPLWIMTTKQAIWNPKKTQLTKVPGTVFNQHEWTVSHGKPKNWNITMQIVANLVLILSDITNVQEYWHIIRRLSWSSQKIWNFKGTIDFELVSSYSCECFSIPKQSGMLTLNWQTPIVVPIWKSSIKIAAHHRTSQLWTHQNKSISQASLPRV
jgi:hypothetical protein